MFARDVALLGSEALLVFAVLIGLFGLRHRLGIGLFVTALGTLHFLETYLAATLYVPLPGGLSVSPGSSILFSGKLILLLLVYIKEDATVARQPVYGLLVGNLLTIGLVFLVREHTPAPSPAADLGFLRQMGWLMVWGSLLLYADAIAIMLVYEKLGRWLRGHLLVRIWLSAAAVLSFDQAGFFLALRFVIDAPPTVFLSGLIAKLGAALLYTLLTAIYLRVWERPGRATGGGQRLQDVFDVLTYRERYHALLEQSGRDSLTGALDRSRLDTQGRQVAELALASGQPVSLLVVDVDRFKDVNDRFGHAIGDEALRSVSHLIKQRMRATDFLFRYGGDEFVICCVGLDGKAAQAFGERLAAGASGSMVAGLGLPLSISIGVATGPQEGEDFETLFCLADERLYARKRAARKGTAALAQTARLKGPPDVISVSAAS